MHSPDPARRHALREGVIGLGAHSTRKSYYPELRRRLEELEEAHAQLRAYQRDLERQVSERTEELRRSNEELRHATLAKDHFLTSMSHELRTPLNSIIGFTSLIQQGTSGPVNEEQVRQLGIVNNAGHHLLELINQILDLAKIEAGESDTLLEEFSVTESLSDAVELLSAQAEEKGLRLIVDTTQAPSAILSDRRRFSQILLNLVGNAVKFTDAGSVTLKVGTEDEHLVVSVTDTGPGISPERQADVFEPFHQALLANGIKPGGTGLGLSISRELATLLGGTISLASTPGAGSCFTLRLPLSGPPGSLEDPHPR